MTAFSTLFPIFPFLALIRWPFGPTMAAPTAFVTLRAVNLLPVASSLNRG